MQAHRLRPSRNGWAIGWPPWRFIHGWTWYPYRMNRTNPLSQGSGHLLRSRVRERTKRLIIRRSAMNHVWPESSHSQDYDNLWKRKKIKTGGAGAWGGTLCNRRVFPRSAWTVLRNPYHSLNRLLLSFPGARHFSGRHNLIYTWFLLKQLGNCL